MAGDGLTPADLTQALGTFGLHADPLYWHAEDLGHGRAEGLIVRLHLGLLCHDGHIEIGDAAAGFFKTLEDLGNNILTDHVLPFGLIGRKQHADLPPAKGAQYGVGDRVQDRIRIRMAQEPLLARQLDPS